MTRSVGDAAALAEGQLGRGAGASLVELPTDIAELSRAFAERGWSDGLPVVPPTEQRVSAMLEYAGRDPLDVLAVIAPRQGEATVQAVAVNAVLAGCEPRQLPVLLAVARALDDPRFNIPAINATTHPVSIFVLLNGPIARELGVHSGSGCFGPSFAANAAIGRAVRLLLLNVGGASPGHGDRATQGSPAKFAFCAAENEEASPWPPFHTTRGIDPEASAVTIFACEGPHNIQDHGSNTALGVLQTIAGAMGQAGSNNLLSRGEPIVALGPEHAATIASEGWSREGVREYLHEHARFPVARLSEEFLESVNVRIEPEDPLQPFTRDDLLPIADAPETIHVLVAGGPGKHSSWMPTFGGQTHPVTLPLLNPAGEPLRSVEELRG